MAIKLADTLAPMADFPAAMAEHIAFADGKTLQEKVDSGDFAGGGDNIVSDIIVQDFEDYSEKEIVIGRWVDGRPVYRLCADTITDPEVKSPIMTSATTPAPYKVTSSSVYSGYSDWKAFGNMNTFGDTYDVWSSVGVPTVSNPQWLQIDMGKSVTFNRILMSPRTYSSTTQDGIKHMPADFTVSGSIDGTNFETLLNVTGAVWDDISVKFFEFEKTGQYRYYRITITDTMDHSTAIIGRIQYYHPSKISIDNLDVIIKQTLIEETGYIIIEYIKTTDAPDSFKPEMLPSLNGSVTVDAEVSDTSENPVQNKVIKKYVDDEIAKVPPGESVTVDTVVSDTSENPIQNKVIKKYVDDEIAKVPSGESVTVDTVVSDTSENPIQNKVIKKYVDGNLTDVRTELANVKKELGDGMTLVADAITAKGVETATDATLEVMAGNIRAIEQGVDTSDATATATDIMAGKTAWVNGVKITGIATSSELHGATISVSTENVELAGTTVTLLKDGSVVGTRIMDENLVCSFAGIQAPGDYTVSTSNGTDSISGTVTISSDNIVNKTVLSCVLSLIPDGSTVTPVDDVAVWLKCAGSKAGYTTTAEVLADNDTMFALTSDENAMKYLERSTSFSDDLCADETFMTYLGQSPYVDYTILNSDLWVSSISSSTYWDLVYPVITVHSSASATITVAGKTFTSDTSGNTQHSMPWGIFSISDSVSGQSFERTIGRDTTDVYVMPEGALYWYGYLKYPIVHSANNNNWQFNQNSIVDGAGRGDYQMIFDLDLNKYSKFYHINTGAIAFRYPLASDENDCSIFVDNEYINVTPVNINKNVTTMGCLLLNNNSSSSGGNHIYAFWLE